MLIYLITFLSIIILIMTMLIYVKIKNQHNCAQNNLPQDTSNSLLISSVSNNILSPQTTTPQPIPQPTPTPPITISTVDMAIEYAFNNLPQIL